jgi:RND family efflux transporter MFP subunit
MSTIETPRPSKPREREAAPEHDRHPHAVTDHDLPKDLPKPSTALVIVVVVLFVALLAGLFVVGYLPHERAAQQASADAAQMAAGNPIVTVVRPKPEAASKDVYLPCDVKPYAQTALYARTNGYLKQWFVDIGGHVSKGQLLAVIDAPDTDAQLDEGKASLEQAKANVVKSVADVSVAETDYHRYLKAQKDNPGSVTQEDVDTKRDAYADALGALDVAKATVTQDAATVERLTVLQGFERIYAPFGGTITARTYDVGALINSSNMAAGQELFDIADTDTLRVFVDVPQNYSTEIRVGQPAYLSVRNYPQREFVGVVARMTGALSEGTRTLPYELDFPNKDGSLYAGMYGQARVPVSDAQPALLIPTSALIFNAAGLQVATVKDGKAYIRRITTGRDFGTQIEVENGLTADDDVVTNPGEHVADGVSVTVAGMDTPIGQH